MQDILIFNRLLEGQVQNYKLYYRYQCLHKKVRLLSIRNNATNTFIVFITTIQIKNEL